MVNMFKTFFGRVGSWLSKGADFVIEHNSSHTNFTRKQRMKHTYFSIGCIAVSFIANKLGLIGKTIRNIISIYYAFDANAQAFGNI